MMKRLIILNRGNLLNSHNDFAKNRVRGFTLAELLAVIVIIAIIAAISMPSLSKAFQGSNVRSAASQVRAGLTLARQHAVLNNTPIDFIIAGLENTSYPTGHEDKCLRAFAIYDPVLEEYVKGWSYLPKGVVFDINEATFVDHQGNNRNFFLIASNTTTDYNFPFSNSAETTSRQCLSLRFRATGSTSIAGTSSTRKVAIVLAEGNTFYTPGQTVSSTAPAYEVFDPSRKAGVFVHPIGGRIEVQHR